MKTYSEVKNFIARSGAEQIASELESQLKKNGSMPVFSDTYKEENGRVYQYVNYVQEGGGVLGVALAGFTYVLEKMGIRFLKLAGTSAGAINTMMIASVNKENYPELKDEKIETTSELILYELLNKNLWDLADGSRFGRWLIRLAISNIKRLKFLIIVLLTSIVFPLFYGLVRLIIWCLNCDLDISIIKLLNYSDHAAIAILLLYLVIIVSALSRFRTWNFGICRGDNFYDWLKSILIKNNIHNTSDLNRAFEKRFEGIRIRPHPDRKGMESSTQITEPYLTLIASDITNQLKTEFPRMNGEYWTPERIEKISPACFARASMSIPVFFSPFRITVEETVIEKSSIQRRGVVANQFYFRKKEDHETKSYSVNFVDGGILSNFPISVFHNPDIRIPRMPTFGAKLEDKEHKDESEVERNREKFFPYLYRIFNTVRFNFDKDFLLKNAVYEQGIGHIDVAGFNWLNFGMDDETKVQLFRRGAEAARTFLLGSEVWVDGKKKTVQGFDWEKFKSDRSKL